MKGARSTKGGFTIVELLIVIVVVAILALVTVVSFRGVQDRARDASRVHDAQSIAKALELYKSQFGNYPNEQSGGWDYSYNYPTTFIKELVESNVISRVPIDAVNTSSGGHYRYHLYPASISYGCDTSRGDYYVLVIVKPEGGTSPQSPGFSCSGRNWSAEGWYVTGGYTNG